MDIMDTVNRMFARQARNMRNIVSRGVLTRTDDERKMQSVQVSLLDGEVLDNVERAQQYGFSSHARDGAEVFMVCVGADRSHGIIFSCDDRRYRVAMQPGEVVIYTDEGDKIELKRDNTIEITTRHLLIKAEEDVTVQTKAFTLNTDTFEVNAATDVGITTPDTGIHTDALAFTNRYGEEVEASFQGGLRATDDVKANDGAVSLREHVHEGVQPGDATTRNPVGG